MIIIAKKLYMNFFNKIVCNYLSLINISYQYYNNLKNTNICSANYCIHIINYQWKKTFT